MDKTAILSDLQNIFKTVFKKENLQIELTTGMGDVEGWDSLNHAVLIDAIEKHYAIKFDLMDMLGIQSVGDICDFVITKKA